MDIIYISTHLVMGTCIITILLVSLTSSETSNDSDNSPWVNRYPEKGITLIKRTADIGHRIAMSILLTHLKYQLTIFLIN